MVRCQTGAWRVFGRDHSWKFFNTRPARVRPDYDAKVGRWTTKDHLLFAEDEYNLYNHGLGDPINHVDLNGFSATGAVAVQSTLDLGLAGAVFLKNYVDMVVADTIGGDKYFHCMANCMSTKISLMGEAAAKLISDTREWFDFNHKGDPPMACYKDQVANYTGRAGGHDQQVPCKTTCSQFRPHALPSHF